MLKLKSSRSSLSSNKLLSTFHRIFGFIQDVQKLEINPHFWGFKKVLEKRDLLT